MYAGIYMYVHVYTYGLKYTHLQAQYVCSSHNDMHLLWGGGGGKGHCMWGKASQEE